ncbi:MAG: hypothetical protein OH338_03810 [Candidatus Parvarchaeota archaeon]|nr:hypothetical protein [Candidatus Parvarchaeota archaeon]MCW1294707.1 hypothetical protein [Candidatus Parvarchaeum tengchongense]MCW1295786.1 hypothetical protein [Candidatus Parvarchaeum tengchongense]MCW1298868.1 hypothetical protein [Candidatus Parvarchaeum tengchongense]MCW1312525.1 hypothetical protein [Candidatus Parvarchaeum tengchongense]
MEEEPSAEMHYSSPIKQTYPKRKHSLTLSFWVAYIAYIALASILVLVVILMILFNFYPNIALNIFVFAELFADLPVLIGSIGAFIIPIPIISTLIGLVILFIAIRYIGGTGAAILYFGLNGVAILIGYSLSSLEPTGNYSNLPNMLTLLFIGLIAGIVSIIGVYLTHKWKLYGVGIVYIGLGVLTAISLVLVPSIEIYVLSIGYLVVLFFLLQGEPYEFDGPKIFSKVNMGLLIASIGIMTIPIALPGVLV